MLSTKLARRARPPLGVCQPQGLVLPLTSVVERMTSLSGSRLDCGAVAAASITQRITARTAAANMRIANGFIECGLPLTCDGQSDGAERADRDSRIARAASSRLCASGLC